MQEAHNSGYTPGNVRFVICDMIIVLDICLQAVHLHDWLRAYLFAALVILQHCLAILTDVTYQGLGHAVDNLVWPGNYLCLKIVGSGNKYGT